MVTKKAAPKKKTITKKVVSASAKKAPVKKAVTKKVAPRERVIKKTSARTVSKQHPVIIRIQEFFSFFSTEK